MTESLADAVEAELVDLSYRLTEPGERECLRCYLLRMIEQFGCDNTHRWTKRWRDLYRGRASVERAFGRLKHEGGLAPLRVRGLERVQLHADLCILATLAQALSRVRAVPLAA